MTEQGTTTEQVTMTEKWNDDRGGDDREVSKELVFYAQSTMMTGRGVHDKTNG